MRILHTSDWHLGRALYGKKRYAEFEAFLNWLLNTMKEEKIDVLLVAGDVFDSNTPSNRAQGLYYQFLCRVANTGCRHVVIIAGNHDSPSFLNAPKNLLKALNVYVIGAMTEDLSEEVVVLKQHDSVEAVVCAIPYLRDKDIRILEAGENIDSKNAKLVAGLASHYAEVCELAQKTVQDVMAQQPERVQDIPIIGMGHLFTAGGKTIDGDGVRELYVGSLAHVGQDVFPMAMDYLALGHLHVPQKVAGLEHIRYCGSPIAMGYGEAKQEKQVLIVDFDGKKPQVMAKAVPCFQVLKRITGNLNEILNEIAALKMSSVDAWLEIEYTGNELVSNLRDQLDAAVAKTSLDILRIKNQRLVDSVLHATSLEDTLDDLNPDLVFSRCLDSYAIEEDERSELQQSYQEVLLSLTEDDVMAQ